MSTKAILKTDIKDKILESDANIMAIAERVGSKFMTIRHQVLNDQTKMTQPHYLGAIYDVLSIPKTVTLYVVIDTNEDKHLRVD